VRIGSEVRQNVESLLFFPLFEGGEVVAKVFDGGHSCRDVVEIEVRFCEVVTDEGVLMLRAFLVARKEEGWRTQDSPGQ
jgi:hypothetical protein